jgi:phosphoglycolate phosphatase
MAEIRRDLIFDLDGTLIDSAPDIARALARLLAELGRPPLDLATVRRLVGDGAPDLVRKALAIASADIKPSAVPPLFERYRGFYLETATHSTRPYPGVIETLARLRDAGHRMAVCTNKLQTPTLQILDALDLAKFFDAVVGGDQAPARKPDPRHLLAAIALLGGTAESAVMIGDGINDAGAAKAAGIPLMVLDSGYGEVAAKDLSGDVILESFSEIPAALERLKR